MPRQSKKIYRDGKVHVLAEKCATCIFRPGNLMQLRKGRVKEMVGRCVIEDSVIPCHETYGGDRAVCRGHFDIYKSTPIQVAERLGLIEFVEAPK